MKNKDYTLTLNQEQANLLNLLCGYTCEPELRKVSKQLQEQGFDTDIDFDNVYLIPSFVDLGKGMFYDGHPVQLEMLEVVDKRS